MMSQLTDEQCNEFLRSAGSFPDMVRAIYAAGQASCMKMLVDELDAVLERPESKALQCKKAFKHMRRAMAKARAHLEQGHV